MSNFINNVINDMDNDITLKKAYKWLYYITGAISLLNIAYIVSLLVSCFHELRWQMEKGSWAFTLAIILSVALGAFTIYVSIITFRYWKQHGDKINNNIPNGTKYTNMLFMSDYLKCYSYNYLLNSTLPYTAFVAAAWLWIVLTGKLNVYDVWYGLIVWTLAAVLTCVIMFVLILFVNLIIRIISEKLLLKVNIANDLRDLGDIYRNSAQVNGTNININGNNNPTAGQTIYDHNVTPGSGFNESNGFYTSTEPINNNQYNNNQYNNDKTHIKFQ